jgi:hypothetical protein
MPKFERQALLAQNPMLPAVLQFALILFITVEVFVMKLKVIVAIYRLLL